MTDLVIPDPNRPLRTEAQARADLRPAFTRSVKYWHMAAAAEDLLINLEAAVARVEIANAEGDPIMSAWLPGARAAIARAKEG